jgi:hypothetical protein
MAQRLSLIPGATYRLLDGKRGYLVELNEEEAVFGIERVTGRSPDDRHTETTISRRKVRMPVGEAEKLELLDDNSIRKES